MNFEENLKRERLKLKTLEEASGEREIKSWEEIIEGRTILEIFKMSKIIALKPSK